MRQGKNLVSNSDFNRKRIRSKEHIEGGGSVLNLPSFASKNIVEGGQLRSTKVNASSRSIRNGGEGNYASLMSSNFADTETMLTNPDFSVVGGQNPFGFVFKKGGKPLFRTLRSNIRRLVPQEFGRELYANVLASYTRNDLQNGGGRYLVSAPIGGAIYGN